MMFFWIVLTILWLFIARQQALLSTALWEQVLTVRMIWRPLPLLVRLVQCERPWLWSDGTDLEVSFDVVYYVLLSEKASDEKRTAPSSTSWTFGEEKFSSFSFCHGGENCPVPINNHRTPSMIILPLMVGNRWILHSSLPLRFQSDFCLYGPWV